MNTDSNELAKPDLVVVVDSGDALISVAGSSTSTSFVSFALGAAERPYIANTGTG